MVHSVNMMPSDYIELARDFAGNIIACGVSVGFSAIPYGSRRLYDVNLQVCNPLDPLGTSHRRELKWTMALEHVEDVYQCCHYNMKGADICILVPEFQNQSFDVVVKWSVSGELLFKFVDPEERVLDTVFRKAEQISFTKSYANLLRPSSSTAITQPINLDWETSAKRRRDDELSRVFN